jgi:pimeloyl-ACP methyl ester carboxylesterase
MTDSLAHVVNTPLGDPWGGLVILHGASSRKENHADMAAAAAAAGLAAVRFDARGHGETGGRLDGRALTDVAAAAALLPAGLPVALRGSSMGGYLALVAAAEAGATAVVAICPAPAPLLAAGMRSRRLEFPVDAQAFGALLDAHPLDAAVAALRVPVLIQHAEGDEEVPVAGSRDLARRFRHPASRLEVYPGGDHRSVQHAVDAQASALTWLRDQLRP